MNTLLGKTLTEIELITSDLGFPKYTAKQITDWLYKKNISSIDEMTNLSVKQRDALKSNYQLGYTAPVNVQVSADGTKKYLYKIAEQRFVEAAYIPDSDRATLCISSQVGCKMGCDFCATGKQGFQQNLTACEILNQIIALPERLSITNVVYMGMGEPLDNLDEVLKTNEIMTSDYGFAWSPKRVTVSTTGLLKPLKRFLDESDCHLALSMHNPFDDERAEVMPVQKAHPLSDIMTVIRSYGFYGQRRFSVEYIMFKDFNDSEKHALELARLLKGLNVRVNLINFHTIPDSRLTGADYQTTEGFQNILKQKGIVTTIRKSRGQDIDAACGLLSTKELVKTKQIQIKNIKINE